MSDTLSGKSVVLAICLLVVGMTAWELFWRSKIYVPSPDDNRYLWAENRGKIKHLESDDVVIIGSSRALFDIQPEQWKEVTGRYPLQLAITGGSPTPVFQDIVDHSDFNGTIVCGFTPELFMSGNGPGGFSWDHPADWIDCFHHRTLAQRFNHWVGKPAQHLFACLENDEDSFFNDLDLKTLINRIPFKGRVFEEPPFPWFGYVNDNREETMLNIVSQDTAYAGMIQRTWQFFLTSGPARDSAEMAQSKAKVLDMTVDYLRRFKDRGGQVIFVRCPSSAWFRTFENKEFPRRDNWDVLLDRTGEKGYHFEDYTVLNQYFCPEWSHLATPDARVFTTDLATIMKNDGILR